MKIEGVKYHNLHSDDYRDGYNTALRDAAEIAREEAYGFRHIATPMMSEAEACELVAAAIEAKMEDKT